MEVREDLSSFPCGDYSRESQLARGGRDRCPLCLRGLWLTAPGRIMIRCDFLWTRRVILTNVRPTSMCLDFTFHMNWGK